MANQAPASGGSWRPWVFGILTILVLGRSLYKIASRASESDRIVAEEINRQGAIDALMVSFDLMEMQLSEAKWGDGSPEAIRRADEANEARMKELFRPYFGWPPASLLPRGNGQALRLLARCSFAYQQQQLPLMQLLRKNGQVRDDDYARLLDAMAVNSGQEQVFGTAAHFGPDKLMVRYPTTEPEKVAERRQAMGLPTLAEEDAAWEAERKAHVVTKAATDVIDAAGEKALSPPAPGAPSP